MRRTTILGGVVLAALYFFAWSNHFNNGFHFDDDHAIVANAFVRSLSNIPAFFTDPATTTELPENRAWRPLVTLTVAIDYALGKGYVPFWFQLSTFLWFTAQLILMAWLFRTILRRIGIEDQSAMRIAGFAAVLYGVHPVMAETVNYVIQRAEVLSTIGVVAGLAMYAGLPNHRRYGLYLVPVGISFLAKAPAMVFPALLVIYIALFEEELPKGRFGRAFRKSLPSVLLTVAFLGLTSAMTPKTFTPGGSSFSSYVFTQFYVTFRYFTSFFLPFRLSADTDLQPISDPFTLEVFGGTVFLALLVWMTIAASRSKQTRPIAFGLSWFLVALLPTALFPLAEVENDHRMFFPFVGLSFAVVWSVALLLRRVAFSSRTRVMLATILACLLLLLALGTRRRNEVWSSEESLWYDVTVKSPRNGRGLMNYALTQLSQGKYPRTLTYLERAEEFTPYYDRLQINFGVTYGAMGKQQEADVHFRRAIELAPQHSDPHFFYGRWLQAVNRLPEAIEQLKSAIALNPVQLEARTVLLSCYERAGRVDELKALAADTARFAPDDPVVRRYLNFQPGEKVVLQTAPAATPESLLNESLSRYQAGDYLGCIDLARKAIAIRPNYAEAWTNVAAGYMQLRKWDDSIAAAQKALEINPSMELARNNLNFAKSQKAAGK